MYSAANPLKNFCYAVSPFASRGVGSTLSVPAHVPGNKATVPGTTSSLLPWNPPPPVGPALPQLASMASNGDATATVPLEWFQYGLEEQQPFKDNNIQHLGKHTYKVRSEATQRTVTAKEAKPYSDPIPPFDYVTVVL